MFPDNFIPILQRIAKECDALQLTWALTGSLNLVLWGFDLQPNDIDLEMDRLSAVRFDQKFRQQAVWDLHMRESERMRSWFGRYDFNGVQVEVMGECQYRDPGAEWVSQSQLVDRVRDRPWRGILLPLLNLADEEQSCRWMGRLEKAERIRQWLELHPELKEGTRRNP